MHKRQTVPTIPQYGSSQPLKKGSATSLRQSGRGIGALKAMVVVLSLLAVLGIVSLRGVSDPKTSPPSHQ